MVASASKSLFKEPREAGFREAQGAKDIELNSQSEHNALGEQLAVSATELPLQKRRTLALSRQSPLRLSLQAPLRPAPQKLTSPQPAAFKPALSFAAAPVAVASTRTSLAPLPPDIPAYRLKLPGGWLVAGSPGRDRLRGSNEAELMFGFGGSDSLQAKGGDDRIYGGGGNDLLAGGQGDDGLFGEAGQDVLFGGAGGDRLNGGDGNDRIQGGSGDDWIVLSRGSDDVEGGAGLDTFDARAEEAGEQSGHAGGQAGGLPGDVDTAQPQGGVTLRYQVDFVETLINNKRRTKLLPQASLVLAFQPSPEDSTIQSTQSPALLGRRTVAKRTAVSELEPVPEQQKLRSIEQIFAPWGEANSIDFSFRKIKSAFTLFDNAQAPAIALNLAEQSLRYSNAALAKPSRLRQTKRSRRGSVATSSPLGSTITTLAVHGFQHATGSFGDDRLAGDEQNNILFGGYGRDTVIGAAGDDLLISNAGDSLTGGLGKDCFKLNAAWYQQIKRGKSIPQDIQAVQIEDFDGAAGDRIHLENEVSTSVALTAEKSLQYRPFASLADGSVLAEQFLVLGQGALQPQTRLIYDGSSGELFYRSPEAVGGLNRQHLVAVLEGAPCLEVEHLWVV